MKSKKFITLLTLICFVVTMLIRPISVLAANAELTRSEERR